MTSVTPASESGSPTGSDVVTVGALSASKGPPSSSSAEPDGSEICDSCAPARTTASAPVSTPARVPAAASAPSVASLKYEPPKAQEAKRESETRTANTNSCLKWAESLQALLNDAQGLSLFQEFLQQEDPERLQMLEFWLACRGLSKQPPSRAHQLVRVIYAQLFLKAQLGIDDRLRKSITQQIIDDTNNRRLLSPTIFGEACAVVERAMTEVMHPNFLTSDIYLNYVQKMQTDDVARSSSRFEPCPSTQREAAAAAHHPDVQLPSCSVNQQPLPVLHEDAELTLCSFPSDKRRSRSNSGTRSSSSSSSSPPGPASHTLPSQIDIFPTKFLRQFGSVGRSNANPSRRLYNYSYNPVSRQDSELQSLSSDARTDSMSDLSLDEIACTKETYASKRHFQRHLRSMRENANINRNSDLVASVIPRTSNARARESAKPLPPQEFAKNLILKLEKLKKEKDAEEIVVRKLNTVEGLTSNEAASSVAGGACSSHHIFTEIDDSQEILDNHMARIWSDKTPRRSPSQAGTPIRPKSPPDGRKAWPPLPAAARLPHAYVINTAKKTKDKDVCSLLSLDSGNGTDPTEGIDHRHRGGGGGGSGSGSSSGGVGHLTKSKSMPEQDEPYTCDYFTGAGSAYFQRSAGKAWSSSRRTLTDSGVSVISGSRGVENITPQSPRCKDKLVSTWLLDSNRVTSATATAATTTTAAAPSMHSAINEENDAAAVSSFAKHKSRPNVIGYASHGSSRCKIGGGGGGGSSCSSLSADRGNGNGIGSFGCAANVRNVLPGQPFVADPSMPPFPFHSVDTDTQLEETRRRLNEMGSKLNRLQTNATTSSTMAALASSRCCENSCIAAVSAAAVAGHPSQAQPYSCYKTESNVTHRPSTLTRTTNRKPPAPPCSEESHFTTVVYNFSDEQMPYLSRIPASPITLRHFKDYMPKKGRYRYYFVTPCEDLEMQPIQEEITDDCEFLPLWKGKVIAQIRAID